jgi:Flp pilus assembly pilin Flp
MDAVIAALIAFLVVGDIAEKVTPWISGKVEQYTEAKE